VTTAYFLSHPVDYFSRSQNYLVVAMLADVKICNYKLSEMPILTCWVYKIPGQVYFIF